MHARTFSLQQIFFPTSPPSLQWTVFNAGSPTFWCGSFAGYFFYMSSRIPAGIPRLDDVQVIAEKLKALELAVPLKFGEREELRLRAVHFDNKNENYTVFVDYIVPVERGGNVIQQSYSARDLLRLLRDGHGLYSDGALSWFSTYWEIVRVKVSQSSERYDRDSRVYYDPFIEKFKAGFAREESASCRVTSFSSWKD